MAEKMKKGEVKTGGLQRERERERERWRERERERGRERGGKGERERRKAGKLDEVECGCRTAKAEETYVECSS